MTDETDRQPVGSELIDSITERLKTRQACVVMAPAYGGKSTLARMISDRFSKGSYRVFHFEFDPGTGASSDEQAMRCLQKFPSLLPKPDRLDAFLALLRGQEANPCLVVLNHLDGLSRDLARSFVEALISSNTHVANTALLITTEAYIFDLFVGLDAEFRSLYRVFLNGFDFETFAHLVNTKKHSLSVNFDPTVPLRWLWQLTGANPFLAFELVWAYHYNQALHSEGLKPRSLTRTDVEEMAAKLTRPGLEECPLFREVIEAIDANLDYVKELGQFVFDGFLEPVLPLKMSVHPLEVVGLARYDNGQLVFSSPLMEKFIRAEFSPRRLGHLNALASQWDEAFAWYARQKGALFTAPTYRERIVTEEVLRRLCSSLEQQSSREALNVFLAQSLTNIFGIASVVFSPHPGTQPQPAPRSEDSQPDSAEPSLLQQESEQFVGPTSFGEVVRLYSPQPVPAWLSRRLPEVLKAYLRGCSVAQDKILAARVKGLREVLGATLRNVLSDLYLESASPERVLGNARDEIMGSGMICDMEWRLVLNGQNLVQREPTPRIDQITASASSKPEINDLAPKEDSWEAQALTSPQQLSRTRVTLPVLDQGRRIGDMSLLFRDNADPTSEELSALTEFSAQLGTAVVHALQLSRISNALDRIDEPLIILDSAGRPAFSNLAARTLLRELTDAEEVGIDYVLQRLTPDIKTGVDLASEGTRYVQFPKRLGTKPYEGTIVYEPLSAKDQGHLGISIHIKHKSHYADLVNVIRALEQARSEVDAIKKLIAVLRSFGHEWVRVYRIENEDLVPGSCIDPSRPHIEADFSTTKLPARGETLSWKAILTGYPQVFGYTPEREHGEIFFTPLGLPVIADPNPISPQQLGKSPGDLWIDFPLARGQESFGKLTIECKQDLTPERFQILCLVSEVCREAFGIIARREKLLGKAERIALQRIGEVRGQFYERLGPLEVVRELLERLAKSPAFTAEGMESCLALFDQALQALRSSIGATTSEPKSQSAGNH